MVRTIHLGGTASNVEVANIGHGLMRMTMSAKPISDEQAFESIKAGIDAAGGAKVYLHSATFYSPTLGLDNLELLARFFEKYPGYADRTVLCVEGGMKFGTLEACLSEENLRETVDIINATLRGTKRLDVYENGRGDPNYPIEETIGVLKKLVEEGKFDHIAMSECNAETLRRACAVHPIVHVEIEVSPFCFERDIRDVVSTAAELKVPVVAYSPLGSGFLTGTIRSVDDFPEGDIRRTYDRFQPENFDQNLRLVDRLTEIAKGKGVTPGQLSLAWVLSLGPHMLPIPGSSHFVRTLENLAAGDIALTDEEQRTINEVVDNITVKGKRFWKSTVDLML